MTQHVFKFMQAITQTVTPIFNSTLQIGDTFTTVFSKIQGLLAVAGQSLCAYLRRNGGRFFHRGCDDGDAGDTRG
jgi:hypothetical protein